jgi:thioesterase domain-containing protein
MIAFEIARQLRAAGEKVGTLLLVEPTVMNSPGTWADRVAGTVVESANLLEGIKQLLIRAPKSIKGRSRYYSQMVAAKLCFALGRPLPESLRWLGYLKSLGPAMRAYKYVPIDCRGTLLYQKMDEEYYEFAREYWGGFLTQGADVVVFQNAYRHEDFMLEPALSQTVELIDRLGARQL